MFLLPAIDFVTFDGEEHHVKEARYKNDVTQAEGIHLGSHQAIDLRHESVSAKGHDEQRRPKFGVAAKTMDGQRPDASIDK